MFVNMDVKEIQFYVYDLVYDRQTIKPNPSFSSCLIRKGELQANLYCEYLYTLLVPCMSKVMNSFWQSGQNMTI